MAGYIGSKTSVTQVDGYNRTEADDEFVNDPNSVISVSGSNVGIGTTSPSQNLHIKGTTNVGVRIEANSNSASIVNFADPSDTNVGQILYDHTSNYMRFNTNDTERMRIDSSGRVGIGTSSPARELTVKGGLLGFRNDTTGYAGTDGFDIGISGTNAYLAQRENAHIIIETNSTERMRLDSSGNLLVGKTSTGYNSGTEISYEDFIRVNRTNGSALYVGRNSSDGELVSFRKDGSTVGSIGVNSDRIYMAADSNTGFAIDASANNLFPATSSGGLNDNVMDLGVISSRWDDIYATNGTIQTSDRNEKQDIEVLSDAEQRVAVACKGLLRKFRWIDAVAEKGDDARIHFGIIAQDLQDAFAAEGLDAGRYAMFISSTWWETQTEVPAVEAVAEVLDEDGNVVTEAVEAKEAYTRTDTYETLEEAPEGATERTRLGVRYPELLAFIIGAM